MEKKDLADPSIIAGELEQTCVQRVSRTRLQGLGLRSVLEGVQCVHRACLCSTYSCSEQVSVVVVKMILYRALNQIYKYTSRGYTHSDIKGFADMTSKEINTLDR